MIKTIEIQRFRCYERVTIDKCARLNVVVGDNGSGKTALLEAIFLALGNSPELSGRFRALRGLDINMSGSVNLLERALWRDLFFNGDMTQPVFVKLSGSGDERRSVRIARNTSRTRIVALNDPQHTAGVQVDDFSGGLRFTWTDAKDKKHEQTATITSQGINVTFAEGSVAEHPNENFYYISSAGSVNATENASRFSELSIAGRKNDVLEVFQSEYPWISDISVEMNGGVGVLYARLEKPFPAMRPLAYVSSGIGRVLSILLCMASAPGGVVLVDEIDNGIHHEHQAAVWRMLIELSDRFKTQLIMTTHSSEWLDALVQSAEGREDDVALWRVKRTDGGVEVKQFGGRQAFVAIQAGTEVR